MSSTAAKLKDEENALFEEKNYEGAIEKDTATIARNTSCDHIHYAVPLYRVYSGSGTDHFYTTNCAEMVNAVNKLGYAYEGEPGYVFRSHASSPPTIPLYRMYRGRAADHFYTTSVRERDNAVNHLGYTDEGIAAYVYATNIRGTIPLYRTYSPRATDHFYTTSESERNNAVAHLGYRDEGIAAYVIPAPT